MKALLKVCFSLILILFVIAALCYSAIRVLINNVVQDNPLVASFAKPNLEDLHRIKDIAIGVSEQQNRLTGEPNKISLNEKDINLAISHFGPRQINIPEDSFARVRLDGEQAYADATISFDAVVMPLYEQNKSQLSPMQLNLANHFIPQLSGRWINASIPLHVENSDDSITIKHGALSIGGITLSQSITDQLVERGMSEARKQKEYKLAVESWKNIRSLAIRDSILHASFVIPTEGGLQIEDYRTLVLEKDEIELVDLYTEELNKYPRRGPLVRVLARLFDLAKQRSSQTNNPVGENRAALLALSQLYGGEQLLAIIAESGFGNQVQTPKPFSIFRRQDLAQHLVLSSGATLAASGDIAELLGINKELSDLLDGRHISAWDLLADKAGVRLAENATRDARSARNIQILLSGARRDSDILPDIGADFEGTNDLFRSDELDDLNELIDLYLDQHKLYRQ